MKPLIYSFTPLSKYENCPKQFHHMYVLKDLPREAPSGAMKEGIDAHAAFEKRLKDKTPLPEAFAKYEPWCLALDPFKPSVELALGMTKDGEASGFWNEETWLRGKIDVVFVASAAAFLTDWKTGKRRENVDELEIFGLLLHANHPELKQIIGSYVWLKENKMGPSHNLSKTGAKYEEMHQRAERVEASLKADFFPPIEGPLCGWCPVKSCQFNRRD